MPAALDKPPPKCITRFTNCRLVQGDSLVHADLQISSDSGKVVHSQSAFFDHHIVPDQTLDLGGRIVSPGLIDVQLNGAFGFNFSSLMEDMSEYKARLEDVNKELAKTGVTAYLPTVTSQKPILYQKTLPYLGPSGSARQARAGAESLGAHVEGPFLSPTKNGIHDIGVLRDAETMLDIIACYGESNVTPAASGGRSAIRMMTAAPERGRMVQLIPELRARGIIFSIGHSEATYEDALDAAEAGAEMITHLFNAMRPLHHRNPGVFGLLGSVKSRIRPYFGIIADGIHLHPATVKIALDTHPDGFILVTDAMHLVGLPDGKYDWTNGNNDGKIVKVGSQLLLDGTQKIAGSSITLIECVNNLLKWTGESIPKALKTVTGTPAAMLGLQGIKGSLEEGADADLIIFSEEQVGGAPQLQVDEVWKFGSLVYRRKL